ncbi:3-oxoadipate enol-lactonase [Azorhizobium sp. AG788]|uniref:3-oxoadipate enol-lactonase n=1 Tax=Azorhizobium sp. AG788 TaxID=2183897 RepID=UPI0031399397
MSVLDIAGERFRFQIDGPQDAPPLVLAHSLGTSLEMFDPVVPALARRFRVVRYDARGHGQSSAPDAVYAMGDLGRDLLNILDKLALGPVDLCGLSLGGMVGQWVALHAPQRLRRLVLANTTAYAGPPRVWEGRIKAVRHSGTAPIADAVVDSWFTLEFRARNPDAVAKVRAMVVATPASGYTGTSCGMRDMDFRPDLPRITTPTLVIVSEQDRATPPAWGEAVAAAIPAARLVRLPGGHMSPIEQPEGFAAAVMGFLA